MKKFEEEAHAFINQYIDGLISVPKNQLSKYFFKNEIKTFGGKEFVVNSWLEDVSPLGSIFVVEAETSLFLRSVVVCCGMLAADSKRKVLSQEEMWELGLG